MATTTTNYGWAKPDRLTDLADPSLHMNPNMNGIDTELKRVEGEAVAALTTNPGRGKGVFSLYETSNSSTLFTEINNFSIPVTAGGVYYLQYHLKVSTTDSAADIEFKGDNWDADYITQGTVTVSGTLHSALAPTSGDTMANPKMDWFNYTSVSAASYGINGASTTACLTRISILAQPSVTGYLHILMRRSGGTSSNTVKVHAGSVLEYRKVG